MMSEATVKAFPVVNIGQAQSSSPGRWWEHHIVSTRAYAESVLAHDGPGVLAALKELWSAILSWQKITGSPVAGVLMAEHTALAKLLADCFSENAGSACTDVVAAAVGRNVESHRTLFPREADRFADLFGEHSALAATYITDLAEGRQADFDAHFAEAVKNGQELDAFTDKVFSKSLHRGLSGRTRPWLGQVPLVLGPSSWGAGAAALPTGPPYDIWWDHFGRDAGIPYDPRGQHRREPAASLPEGGEIQANGGRIVKRIGFLWFFPDEDVRDKIEAATGERPSESIEAQVTHCNPTPGTFPSLGDFTDPDTGLVCFLEIPQEWQDAWSGLDELKAALGQVGDDPFADAVEWEEGVGYVPYDPVGTPPYWGEWGALGECGKVGPFDTIDEAFSAAADAATEHGATALPGDGWAQVKDSKGKGKGPIT
jgi:hypothetical protein